MNKYLLSLLCVSSVSFGAVAADVLEFTYADGALASYGKGKTEIVDVAMCINDPTLVGMKLLSVKAYINTVDGIGEASVWLSNELKVENKLNVADIVTCSVTPVEVTLEGESVGLLEGSFETPYVFTGEPVYVGYSIEVTATDNEAQKNPVIVSEVYNPNGFFVHMQKSILKWMDYSESEGCVAYIIAEIEGKFDANSVGISGYKNIYAMEGEDYNAEIMISNKGNSPVNSLSYTYSYDGSGEAYSGSVELPTAVDPSLSLVAPVTLPFKGISGLGLHKMNLQITEVNGNANSSVASNIEAEVNVVPFKPVKRPLVEEYTGLWCGWCTGGYIAMELINEDYPDSQVSICFHNGDPMEVTSKYPLNIKGFPSSSIDRTSILDPFYGTTDIDFGISYDLENAMNEFAIAGIEIEVSMENDKVEVSSEVTFVLDINDANYQVGYILVADGLTNPGWYQSNYYSNMKGLEGSKLEPLTEWPSKVPDLVFNDVAVDVSGMMGVKGSLPSEIKVGEKYSGTFSFDIADNKVIQDPHNLKVAVFVVDKNNGYIVNANKMGVTDEAGVNSITDGKEVVGREIYDLSGRKVSNPSKGIFIIKERLSDGSFKTTKTAIK